MNELILSNETAISVFTRNAMDETLHKIESEVMSFIPDTSTTKGRKDIASLAHKVSRSKVVLDNAGKELTSEWKKKSRLVDSSRKDARDFLDNLRDKVRKPLTEWEEKEAARIEQERIFAEIEEGHIEAIAMNDLFNREKAIAEKERIAKEKEEEELRIKEEARIKAEKIAYEQKLKEHATEKARLKAEKAANDKIEEINRLKADAEARAEKIKRDAIESGLKIKLQAEQAEKDRLKAIELAKIEKDKAVQEAIKKSKLEAERIEQEKVKAEEEARRKAEIAASNKAHIAKLNNEALLCFKNNGFSQQQSKKIITLIAKGFIDNVTINY